jgi:hypothetical protein
MPFQGELKMPRAFLILTRVKLLTTFIRNRSMMFWGVIWPVLWVFLYAFVFKAPEGVPAVFYYGTAIAFLLQIAFSTLSISGAFEAALDAIKMPYLLRFTRVNSRSYVSALLLSYFIFAIIQSVILVAIAAPLFKIGYVTVGVALPLIFLLALASATLYLELGIIVSYVLLLLRLSRLAQVASFVPFVLMYVAVLGQVVSNFTGAAIVYIPFNELYTITMIGVANSAGPSYVSYALNTYGISGASLSFMAILLPLWLVGLAFVAIGLVATYNRSGLRGKYKTEDIIGG